jgi:RHS repeat-associated protein
MDRDFGASRLSLESRERSRRAGPLRSGRRSNSASFNVRFPGQYADAETGFHDNRYRAYDPTAGRYVSADPIGQMGGVNVYGYARNRPSMLLDPYGLDIWIEGPSGSEPNAHQSVNVGDPNGDYVSKSFGVDPTDSQCWAGCVYDDVDRGGPIEAYSTTTPDQDAAAISALENAAAQDSEAIYGLDATCRTYSQDKYWQFWKMYGGASPPPNRPDAPRAPFRRVSGPSVTSSTTTSSTGTSTSR